MKILKKRALAFLIDGFMFSILWVYGQSFLLNWFPNAGKIINIILFVPLFFKDLVFRNASIGKKLLGIEIYNDDWKSPSFGTLIKRAFLMTTIGYVLFFKSKFVDGEIISLFDWEREHLHTRVIDKKVLKNLQEQAQQEKGEYKANMTKLYNEYLIGIYMK